MGTAALATIVVLSLIAGVVVQRILRGAIPNEWLVLAVAAAFGAYFFSETLPESASLHVYLKEWGPQWDGFYWVAGLIGGVLVGAVVDIAMRRAPARVVEPA